MAKKLIKVAIYEMLGIKIENKGGKEMEDLAETIALVREAEAKRKEKNRIQATKQGMRQGRKEAKIEDAMRMLKENMSKTLVRKITGLTCKEINNISVNL